MRFTDIRYKDLHIESFDLPIEQAWCVLGGNGSGKSHLAELIAGEAQPKSGSISKLPQSVCWASFEMQQATYERELANDDTDFMDRIDTGTSGLGMLLESGCEETAARHMADRFGIGHVLDRGYKLLSSGEARKTLLLKEILSHLDLLILDEPFEGLDAQSRRQLSTLCRDLIESGHRILLLVNRIDDVCDWTDRLAVLRNGKIICSGERAEVLQMPEVRHIMEFDASELPDLPPPPSGDRIHFDPLIELEQGRIQYTDIVQFENLNWALRPGQHTIITGPNGAGKSTLLQLFSGDHPQCYSNDLKIFGYQRGTGETIWDIKQHIGLASAAFHREYRAPGNALTTLISGFYDSIGLYNDFTQEQLVIAKQWLGAMGLRDYANTPFRQLSWGQQRLIIIARALIKQPPLLILDEPTQGLDDLNRHLVLAFIERLAALKHTTILFVSHRQDEHLPLFSNRIHFFPSNKEGIRFETEVTRGEKAVASARE